MTKEYEILTTDTVAQYLAAHPSAAPNLDTENIVQTEEIGDGNLNLVFRVQDGSGASVIVKQALPYVRMTGEGWPMTPERAAKEAHSLDVHSRLVPDLVVNVYEYDPENYVLAMEDLSDHTVWRGVLNEGIRTDGVAQALGRYVANVAFSTSVLGSDRADVAEELATTQNPELCVITEDLVFTEPVFDAGRNSVIPANEVDAKELAQDEAFQQAMAVAKWRFMTEAQALLHGDLHTGSVMVAMDEGDVSSVKVFDSEFAFYGPIGFDLGALVANYTFAASRALALGEADRCDWALAMIGQTWDSFAQVFKELAVDNQSPKLWDGRFIDTLLASLFEDMLLFASAKMARRIVGAAKVKDIESLEEGIRAAAARGVLHASRFLAANYTSRLTTDQVIAGIREALGN